MDISKAFTTYILSIFSDPDTPVLISSFRTLKELRLTALSFFIEEEEFPDDRLDFTVFINRYDGEGGVKSEKVNCMIWLDDYNEEVKYCEDYGGGMTRHIDMNGEEIMFGDDTDGGIYQKVKE